MIGDLLIAIEATSQASADSIGREAAELSPGNGTYTHLNENLYVAEFASDSKYTHVVLHSSSFLWYLLVCQPIYC